MTTGSEQNVAANGDLFWLFRDAFSLFHLGRKPTALLLLLCAVDTLAERDLPGAPAEDGQRFQQYLRRRLPRYTRAEHFRVRVRGESELLRIERVLYRFFRNPIVHDGLTLDLEKVPNVAVSIDWSDEARYLRWADREGKVVIGGDWLVDVVGGVVRDATTVPGSAAADVRGPAPGAATPGQAPAGQGGG